MEEAISSFEKASRSEPDSLFLLNEFTQAYLELGQLYIILENENAGAVLKKGLVRSLEIQKRSPLEMVSGLLVRDAHVNLGRYHDQLGRNEEAIANYKSAIQTATPLLAPTTSPHLNFSPMERQRYFQERQSLERSIAWLKKRVNELKEGTNE